MKKRIGLLPDKTLGYLMSIVYNAKKKKFNLKLPKKEIRSGNTFFRDLENLDLNNFYTLKTIVTMRTITILGALRNKLIQKRNAGVSLEIIPGYTLGLSGLTKRIGQLESLKSKLEPLVNKEISDKQQTKIMGWGSIYDSLIDIITVSPQQMKELKKFLKKYIKQYSNRKLDGQREQGLREPNYEVKNLKIRLKNEEIGEMYNWTDVLIDNPISGWFCHNLLYLHSFKRIVLKSFIFKPKTSRAGAKYMGGTVWTSPGEYHWRAIIDVNKSFAQIKHPKNRDSWLEDKQLKFRLANGGIDQLDFTSAPVQWPIFEGFYKLWKADGKGEYSTEKVVNSCSKCFGNSVDRRYISTNVSNIKNKKIKGRSFETRIIWEFSKSKNLWLFEILPLNSNK